MKCEAFQLFISIFRSPWHKNACDTDTGFIMCPWILVNLALKAQKLTALQAINWNEIVVKALKRIFFSAKWIILVVCEKY